MLCCLNTVKSVMSDTIWFGKLC